MKTKIFLIASIIATSGLLAGCNLADEPKNNTIDGLVTIPNNTTTEVKQAVSEDIAVEFLDDEEDNSIEVIHLDDEIAID
ncbi:hypothetical protein AP064_05120 [Candidatus Liberibacter solanacearum]|uniref:Uncharacterized protein n=1 Tax=Candidatus Liberibacter solanacearum TaxID=556287 RepID=A0A0F4VM02_9HYPH|nr:hypothetical protein [Candidatus Liberibacter solanacearum]KJZ82511.1 hypothetical protein DJ66_0118 [Candidatus Liberibacter solanacearum]KQC48741.1 hypothetical protein AP064_05120 [Candidatus Liberibacter solanacearum]